MAENKKLKEENKTLKESNAVKNQRELLKIILSKIQELEKKHPYKVVGEYDTYSQYNEGWQDCLDYIENILHEHFADQGENRERRRK